MDNAGHSAVNIIDEDIENLYQSFKLKTETPIENKIFIDVKNDTQYLSDFIDDLPHNAYINKGATGCGGTTLAITNDQPYVIAVHSQNVIINKSRQHSNLCPVYGNTTNEEIESYINANKKNGVINKFIVTYDSLPRLLEFIKPEDYRLLVDEVQVLVRYLGHFKITVANKLLNQIYKFKSTSFLTATPTILEYLPAPLKKLDYVEYVWPNLIKPEIKHMYCGNQLQTNVCAFIIDKLDNTDDEIYVFYNSKIGTVSTIQKLLMAKDDLSIDDVNIIFADTDENLKYFKKHIKSKNIKLGYNLKTDENGRPLPGYNKRINFISSFGFEGVDFYSFGKDVSTLIVADSQSKSMRYDISIDLPQIMGRFRRDKTSNLFPKNEIYFIWKSMSNEINYETEEEILKSIARHILGSKSILQLCNKLYSDNKHDKKMSNINTLSRLEPYLISENMNDPIDKRNYIMNEYAMEGIMSAYCAMNIDYHILANEGDLENSVIHNSLKDISKEVNTFSIKSLSTEYSVALDRKVPFSKIAKEYHALYIESQDINNRDKIDHYADQMQYLLEMSDLLKSIMDFNIDVEYLKTYKFNERYFSEYMSNKMTIKNIKSDIEKYGLTVGSLIEYDNVIPLLEKIYKDNNITAKPKKSSINDFCVTRHKMIDRIKFLEIINILGDK